MTHRPGSFACYALPVMIVALIFATGCNSNSGSAALHSADAATTVRPLAAPIPLDPMEITATPTIRERLRVGQPTWEAVGASITVAARVDVDETRVTRVGSPVAGRIAELTMREGQVVQRGQLLARVYSTELSNGQLAFLKAVSQRQVAQRAVDRAKLLLKADVIGVAELQRREAELAQASAEMDTFHDQLLLLGMSRAAVARLQKTRTLVSTSQIVASMAGTILDRKVTLGQVVQPGDTIYEIAELSQVWLVADVPERNAGYLTVGQDVEAAVAALPNQPLHGNLSFVSATVNPDTHTVRVRMEVPNADRKLKPAMLATMVLKDTAKQHQVIPSQAVIRESNADYVFIQRDSDTFALRHVTLDGEYSGKRVVVAGLQADDTIVLDGAFHLNNERRRRTAHGDEGV